MNPKYPNSQQLEEMCKAIQAAYPSIVDLADSFSRFSSTFLATSTSQEVGRSLNLQDLQRLWDVCTPVANPLNLLLVKDMETWTLFEEKYRMKATPDRRLAGVEVRTSSFMPSNVLVGMSTSREDPRSLGSYVVLFIERL